MQIPFFNKKNVHDNKSYLGLFLKEAEVVLFLITVENGEYLIKEKESVTYSDGWEHIIEDLDEGIFRIEQKHHITFHETIFFIYSHLIDFERKEIKKPYVDKIKDIVKNLELKALGYIECHDAIAEFIEKKEGFALTAVLVEIDKSQMDVFVYKGGKVIFQNTTAKTEKNAEDIVHAIEPIKGTFVLPTRIIVYDSNDVLNKYGDILTHRWDPELFVQLPRIELLKEDDIHTAFLRIFEGQNISNAAPQEKYIEEAEVVEEKHVEEIADTGFVVGEDVMVIDKSEKKKISLPFNIKNIFAPFSHIQISRSPLVLGIIAFASILVIIGSLVLNEFYLHTATLRVFLPVSHIKKNLIAPVSFQISTASADFTQSKTTTGKREVGDKAHGSVTIFNLDDKEKSFSGGTIFVFNNLNYSLDSDVAVPAATIDTSTNDTKPGKGTANLTASEIGTDSNLDKGKRFKIGDLSQTIYYAINDDAFKGGSKQEIQTVAKKDIDDLTESITKKAQASDLLNKNNGAEGQNRSIESLSTIDITDIQSSKEVGEGATSVSVSAKAVKEIYTYDEEALLNFLLKQVEADVKNGLEVQKSNLTYSVGKATLKSDTIDINISVDAKAAPIVDEKKLLHETVLKDKSQIEKNLKEKYDIAGYELTIKQPLPFIGSITPLFEKNIRLLISTQ